MDAMDNVLPDTGITAAEAQSAVVEQNWKLLHYFNLYRLGMAALAIAVAFSSKKIPPLGDISPALFAFFSLVYGGIALASLETIRRRLPGFETQVTVLAFADVAVITLLMHTSGGMTSGLGLLLMVAVAGTSLMLGKRMTIFFASLATISVLIEHSWGFLTGSEQIADGYPQVGMLGLGLFATATLTYTLANRLRSTEALAERRGVDLANLAQVNEFVIQRMQSGVIVCDRAGHVRTINGTARNFLAVQHEIRGKPLLADLSPDLSTQLFQWMQVPANRTRKLLRTRPGYTLLPRFVLAGEDQNSGILIFLEDTSILRQQAQQLKMAALARLTASIAHEIRNPLGAITNAAQLLGESSSENNEERRLLRIIEEQSRRMNTIVENIMQLSRRDHVSPVKLELEPWAQAFVPPFCQTLQIPTEAISIVGGKGIHVCMDPDQLYQVVANLCQNAFRHSPAFSSQALIELEIGIDEEEKRPFLDIIDWGTGVPPEIVDSIFDPFFTTTPKGTGLGLYIARELCEGNGARLDYHFGEGAGSRFRITFSRDEECTEFGL